MGTLVMIRALISELAIKDKRTSAAMPTTVRVSRSYQPTEADIRHYRKNQLILPAGKE